MPAEFDDLWDPSSLFEDCPTGPLVPPTHFLAHGNPVVQPPSVLSDHDVYNANPTLMPASDLPLITNHQEDYSLTDQEWWHIYNVPTQPPTNHDYLLPQGNTVQPVLLPLPPPPAQNSESMIPTNPPTLQREEYSMIDQEWCDFQFEGSINPDDELECAFADVMERAAATIRMQESKEVVGLPPKLPPQASKSPEELQSLGQGKRKNHWTQEEHRLFLEGLKAYEYGEWKNIARDFVKTRTHIQIASHAQKFRKRSNGSGVDNTKRKRRSIHDITTTDHIPNPSYRWRST